jgi:hypothetical protein
MAPGERPQSIIEEEVELEEQEDSPIGNEEYNTDFGQRSGIKLYKTET